MSSRDRLRAVAEDNARIFDAGCYTAFDGTRVEIAQALSASVAGTRVIRAQDLSPERGGATEHAAFTCHSETTLQAILVKSEEWTGHDPDHDRPMAVLNFASATTPGGGYLRGGSAQEESLCRASTLYPSLLSQPEVYARNKALGNAIYEDALILSPDVLVFRDCHHNLLPRPIPVTILTCAAPNRSALMRNGSDARTLACSEAAIRRRAALVVEAIAQVSPNISILGAWGCGVFGNDPSLVAREFLEAVMARDGIGDTHFAIPMDTDDRIHTAFLQELGKWVSRCQA